MSLFPDIAQSIARSSANEMAIAALRNIPGLPPIVQAVHILAVAAVMASMVFIALRVLGLAVPGQQPREMLNRLMPWTWTALGVLLLSGLPFVLARPFRYFSNPVFGWKMAFLAMAVILGLIMSRRIRLSPDGGTVAQALSLKLLAAAVITFWVLTVLAGRWIAYAEYLFAPA